MPEQAVPKPRTSVPDVAEARAFGAPKRRNQRVGTVRERIERYIELLRRLRELGTERERLFTETMREIRELKAVYHLNYTRVVLTRYREAVEAAFGTGHPAIKYLHSFRNDLNEINENQRNRVADQHHNMRPIDPDWFVERALGRLNAGDYGEAVASVLMLTGRRPVEVCMTGQFSLVEDRTDALLFAGQAKGKGLEKPPFVIPVLGDPEDLLEAIETIRARKAPFVIEADVNNLVGKVIADGAKRIFGFTPQELRKVYATIAYADYSEQRPTPRKSKDAFFAEILGHARGDIKTAQSYTGAFYLEGQFDTAERDFQDSLRDVLGVLQERFDKADQHARTFIEADIQKVRDLMESDDRAVPVSTPADQREIGKLTASQQAMLRAILAGKATYDGVERWTVEALQRRKLVTVERDESQRIAPRTLRLTPRGTELAALLAQPRRLE